MGFFKKIGTAIGRFLSLLVPVAGRGGFASRHPILRAIVQAILLALVLVGLWYLNRRWELDRYVRAPLPRLREFWLPLLFLLFYALAWLGLALWRSITADPVESDFPDIDLAWDEAMDAMAEAGIGLGEAPTFLVLGRPSGGERALFGAGGVKLQVKQVPRRPEAPLTVSANADGIYITCAGASLLGAMATRLAGAADNSGADPMAGSVGEAEVSTASATGPVAAPGDPTGPEEAEPTTALLVADEEDDDRPGPGPGLGPGGRRASISRDAAETDRLSARLRHLCRRIARERRPYCPINGVLVLIPMATTVADPEAKEAGTLIARDLASVRETLLVDCPSFALVCDLERLPGFAEFLAFFPEGQRRRFLGQPFPLAPDLDGPARARMVERGIHWIGDALFPRLIYKFWSPEGTDATGTMTTAANVRLYGFLDGIRASQRRVSRIVNRGIVMPSGGAPLFGGCGFAATGKDIVREQGFAQSVFRSLVESQNHVAWTSDARRIDAEYRRWSALGYAGLGLAVAALAALAVLFWPRR